jgi:tetratricopeptide (TPR) repeat protein
MAATEGWPLGVALIARAAAAASLPERPARSEAFEFLAEEVLGRLDATLRAAVIESALPRELDTDICAGLGLPGGFPELAEREGLFLRPMDRERTRFRYHPLFRSFLLSRFESERDAAERGAAHRTAAAALLASGETTEAIEHWIAAAAWREAVDVVTRNDDALINFAPDRVGEWLTQMPADLRAEPATRYLEGRLHWATGHMEAALPPLREASQGFRAAGEHEHDWAARALLAEGLYLLGGWDELVQLAEGFDGHDAAGAPSAALLVALRATDVLRNTGRHDESNRILERVQAHPARSSVGGRLASELAFIDYEAGRVDDAIKRLERETRRAGREQPAAARASLALNFASILGEVGFEERSLAESERLIRIGRDDGLPRALRYAELHSGQWHSAAGRVKEATAALARAGVTDETHYDDYLATLIHAQLASARGEPTQAVALSEKASTRCCPVRWGVTRGPACSRAARGSTGSRVT